MNVRAKFTCSSIKKYKTNHWDPETKSSVDGFMYAYEFNAVSDGAGENAKFFASTPTGNLSMSAVRDDLFAPGESYYLDFIPAS